MFWLNFCNGSRPKLVEKLFNVKFHNCNRNHWPDQTTWVHPGFLWGSWISILSFLGSFATDHCSFIYPFCFVPYIVCPFTIYRPPRYNWNIVESGVKHHQTNKQTNKQTIYRFCLPLWYLHSLFLNIKNKFRQWKSLIQMLITDDFFLMKCTIILLYVTIK